MEDEPTDRGTDAAEVPADVSPEESLAAHKKAVDLEFTLFYTDQMPRLVTFLIVQGAGRTVAADLAQDVMTDVYRQWDDLDNPRAWIRTVATRAWWRWIRKNRAVDLSHRLDELLPATSRAEPEEIENRHELLTVLNLLPVGQRQVMAWTYDGYQPTEIAVLLQMEPATVRSRLRDARATLRKRYGIRP
jgi:RNA polymerase sigma-70 factor (ECF subfamily)